MNELRIMPARSLIRILDWLDEAGIECWLDGGWGVDALLGYQTREHKDVDLIVRVADTELMHKTLRPHGFDLKEGCPPDSFVLADGLGLEIDIHAVRFDGAGNGIYRMENGEDWVFPAAGFQGRGSVDGRSVPCLSAEVQVLCHAHGYCPTPKDLKDMELLRTRFGVELPPHLTSSG